MTRVERSSVIQYIIHNIRPTWLLFAVRTVNPCITVYQPATK